MKIAPRIFHKGLFLAYAIGMITFPHGAMSVRKAVAAYLASLTVSGRAGSTVRLYHSILYQMAAHVGEERLVGKVNEGEIAAYIAELQRNRCSQGYVALTARVIHTFFGWLVTQGNLKKNPLAGATIKKPPPPVVRPFADREIQALLRATENEMERALLITLLDTGLRASELCSLRKRDIDFERATIVVLGKGHKQRTLALNPGVRHALEQYAGKAPNSDGRVWPAGFECRQLERILDRIAARAHVSGVYPHRFRHHFAMAFLAETGNALALQSLLGHSNLAMTQRYIAASQSELAVEVHRQHPLV